MASRAVRKALRRSDTSVERETRLLGALERLTALVARLEENVGTLGEEERIHLKRMGHLQGQFDKIKCAWMKMLTAV